MNAFNTRVLVAIADNARLCTDIGAIARPDVMDSKVAIGASGFIDVSDEAVHDIASLSTVKPEHRLGLLLKAYWSERQQFGLHQVKARLLVNPPPSLKLDDGMTMTVVGQNFLDGSHGTRLENGVPLSDVVRASIGGEFTGFFDDVAIFWDAGVDFNLVADYVIPGSTVTLLKPSPRTNSFWLNWAKFDSSFARATKVFSSKFKIAHLQGVVQNDVDIQIFGLDALKQA
jgi:hypothetical protein